MCVYVQMPPEVRRGHKILCNWGYWQLNPDSLQEQEVLLDHQDIFSVPSSPPSPPLLCLKASIIVYFQPSPFILSVYLSLCSFGIAAHPVLTVFFFFFFLLWIEYRKCEAVRFHFTSPFLSDICYHSLSCFGHYKISSLACTDILTNCCVFIHMDGFKLELHYLFYTHLTFLSVFLSYCWIHFFIFKFIY